MRPSHIVNRDAWAGVHAVICSVTDNVGQVRLVHNTIHHFANERVLVRDVNLIVHVVLDSLHG